MNALLNVWSLILGLLSWLTALFDISRGRRSCWGVLASFLCCAGAMLLQLFQVRTLVQINDISALMDTIGAVTFAAAVLFAVTLLLNLIAVVHGRKAG